MDLDTELKTYQDNIESLLAQHAGQFVVIKDTTILGAFIDYADALAAGYERFGPTAFLVKKVEAVETVLRFTRDLGCRT